MEVELVLVYLLKVPLNVVEVLERQPQLALSQVGLTYFGLVPHALHVVHVQLCTLLAEEQHCLLRVLQLVVSDLVPGGARVQESVGQVELPRLVEQLVRSVHATSSLVNLRLHHVQLNHRWRVLNSLIDGLQSLFEVELEQVVLRSIVEEPQRHSGVLLLLILFQPQSHVGVHLVEHLSEYFVNNLDLITVYVELSHVDQHGGHALYYEWLCILDELFSEESPMEEVQLNSLMSSSSGEVLFVFCEYFLNF